MHGASNSTRRLSPTLKAVKSRRKGHKEDFDFEELQAAIELLSCNNKEREEEDK